MIEKIKLKDVAAYDSNGVEINLKKVNYIFGSNGTGKTTISEFLRNKEMFPTCNIEWRQNRSNYDLFVYNRYFVRENFNVRNEIKGIFTLGKESTEKLELIEEKEKNVKKHQERIEKLDINISEKREQLESLTNNFRNQCWDLKLKYDEQFIEAFTGLRNNRERFMEKFLHEAENNKSELYTFDDLIKRVDSVFKGPQYKINIISKLNYDTTIEKMPIFQTKIIGKEDIDIAKLINSLNISDWVQQGHRHLEHTDGKCPFCQQELPPSFKQQLDEYFDETFSEQISILNSLILEYKTRTTDIIKKCHSLIDNDIPFIDNGKIAALYEVINSIYKENIHLLDKKVSEPSRSIELSSIEEYLKEINFKIEQANTQIIEVNRVIDNIKEEKHKLIQDIWSFIVNENRHNYEYYVNQFKREDKAIEQMEKNKEKQMTFKRTLQGEVYELQNQLTSVLPSINEINGLLKSFGFTNFKLVQSDEKGNYKIVRENGKDANETLSEGEKTFITFLYFYQLINGSNDQNKVNTERIIVIDDPISSLDSNILFIVSNLINSLKQKVRSNRSNFVQLIVLTHNVYFHKEISFNKGKGNQILNDESFWILRKTNDITYIKAYDENPIKNSYELIWKELRENPNSITTPNIMRRILESYFKFFGNIDLDKIIESFPEEEKVACHSLLSWVNDGSHHLNDDLFVDSSEEVNHKYFNVFRRIFFNSHHQSHFEMMMGEYQSDVTEQGEALLSVEQAAAGME